MAQTIKELEIKKAELEKTLQAVSSTIATTDSISEKAKAIEEKKSLERAFGQIARSIQNAKDDEFRTSLEEKYSTKGHPKADKLFSLAWEYGHSAGYNEVDLYYEELSELLSIKEKRNDRDN